jgi:hypothetical protein
MVCTLFKVLITSWRVALKDRILRKKIVCRGFPETVFRNLAPILPNTIFPILHSLYVLTNICKITAYKFVKNKLYQIFSNTCKPNIADFTRIILEDIGWKVAKCKMWKLQIFVITNLCKLIFVTFGRIGTWSVTCDILVRLDLFSTLASVFLLKNNVFAKHFWKIGNVDKAEKQCFTYVCNILLWDKGNF